MSTTVCQVSMTDARDACSDSTCTSIISTEYIAKHHDQLYVLHCRRPSFREIVDVLRRLLPGPSGLGDPSDQPPKF